MLNGPSSKATISGLQCSRTLPIEYSRQLSLSHFPLLLLISANIAFRSAQAGNSGLYVNAVSWLLDRTSNTCIACGPKFYIR